MKIVYSNASKPNLPQTDPGKSLGGYLSNTPILNGSLNNLFPIVSNQSLNNLPFEVRMIGLKNDSTRTYSTISLTFTVQTDSIFKYSFAISEPTEDDCGDLYEILQGSRSLPYYSEFIEITSGTTYELDSSILTSKSLGLWLKRDFKAEKKNKVSAFNTDECLLWKEKYDTFLAETSDDTEQDVDTFSISLSYSLEESSSSSSYSNSMS